MGNDILSGKDGLLETGTPRSYLSGHSDVLEGALSILEIEDLLYPSLTLWPYIYLYPGGLNAGS